jgi:predicted Zn-dependent peptidase
VTDSTPAQPTGSTRTLLKERDDAGNVVSTVRRTLLPGGLRVITEQMAGARSASVGVWIGVGSRDETPSLSGASHFLEHVLFKGTASRTAMEISETLDEVGGEFNAFTAREYTCFHARVLGEDLARAIDVLGDMMTSSKLASADIEAERTVILDEIAMHEDDPDDVVNNLLATQMWGERSLGRPIAGTTETIATMSRAQISRYYRTRYRPENMVLSVAGNLDHAKVVRAAKRAFGRNGFLDDAEARPAPPRSTDRFLASRGGSARETRPFEQVNLILGFDGVDRNDPRRYPMGVLNAVLGGGTSSRLFQEVRERRGLAYAVYSFTSHYSDAGAFAIEVGCLPAREAAVLDVLKAELVRLTEEPISEAELARSQGQLRGGLVLGLEDTGARMARIGKAELMYRELWGIDEVLARIEAVTVDDVHALAKEIFSGEETLAVVGPPQYVSD